MRKPRRIPPRLRFPPHRTAPLLALACTAQAAFGQGEPFPVSKTTTLKTDGLVFHVEGRQRIPSNVKIASWRAIEIRGQGGEAVLEVEGVLELKAVTGGRVQVRDVWIEPMPECRSLYLANTTFHGSGGIRPSPEGPCAPQIYMEFLELGPGTSLELDMTAGSVDLQASIARAPVRFTGLRPSPKKPNGTKVEVLTCKSKKKGGLNGGLLVEGMRDVLVRNCDLAGERTAFVDCEKLDFDGNNSRSRLTEFRHSDYGGLKKTKIHNCDFRSPRVVTWTPVKTEGRAERLLMDHCWIGGWTDPDSILAEVIEDSSRDPTSGVRVDFRKLRERPFGLGGMAEGPGGGR